MLGFWVSVNLSLRPIGLQIPLSDLHTPKPRTLLHKKLSPKKNETIGSGLCREAMELWAISWTAKESETRLHPKNSLGFWGLGLWVWGFGFRV